MALKSLKVTTTTVFIALNRKGFVKATKSRSSLARDEIGVMLKLSVPESAFRSPVVEANIVVPHHAVEVPELTAEIVEPSTERKDRHEQRN